MNFAVFNSGSIPAVVPATAPRWEELEADPRHAALENLAGLLRGQGYDAAVDALHLTVRHGGRVVELWAQRRPDDDYRMWFCWSGEVWICEIALPQDAVVAVKQALRGDRAGAAALSGTPARGGRRAIQRRTARTGVVRSERGEPPRRGGEGLRSPAPQPRPLDLTSPRRARRPRSALPTPGGLRVLPPAGVDPGRAHPARVWNCLLGGDDNGPADWELADRLAAVHPGIGEQARHRAEFLIRAIEYLAGRGVDQFLDLGVGLPALVSTGEITQRHNPAARVVYVDNDAFVLARACERLTGAGCGVVAADLTDPAALLEQASGQLDLGRPVAVLMLGVLPHITRDARARRIVAQLMGRVAAGSFLAFTHATAVTRPEEAQKAARVWNRHTMPVTLRGPRQIARLFDGLEWIRPGLAPCPQWHPRTTDTGGIGGEVEEWAGVVRKP